MQSLDSLAEKMGSSYTQPPPPVVVLESLNPQSSEIPRVDRYVASSKRNTEFGQSSKWKEIDGSPYVMGPRPSQYTPKVGNMLPSSVQSAQTPLGIDAMSFAFCIA